MYATEDLTGKRFGKLTAIHRNKVSRNGGSSWLCECDCGRSCSVGGMELIRGNKKNCGDCNFGHYFFYPDYAECILPNGEAFQIDAEDYKLVSQYRWVITPSGYFVASTGKRDAHVFLHRLIMKPPDGMYVDHIDCNKGNCRKVNLRLCIKKENNRNVGLQKNNQCGYKGVYWASDRGKWRAEITVDKKHIHIGSFEPAEMAARAYDEYAIAHFGEYAKTNEMLGLLNREL